MTNFLKYFLSSILPSIPAVVQAVRALATEAHSGAEKKQIAMDSLNVAAAVAQHFDPNDTEKIAAATSLVSSSIDTIVALTKPKPLAAGAVATQ